MTTTYYRKQGRRYVPVFEDARELYDTLNEGTYIVRVRPGHTRMVRIVEPASDEVEGALMTLREEIIIEMVAARAWGATARTIADVVDAGIAHARRKMKECRQQEKDLLAFLRSNREDIEKTWPDWKANAYTIRPSTDDD